MRCIAFCIRTSNWSQSSGSSWNSKPSGIAVDVPRLGDRLESAHDDAADFFLEVDVAVGIADHRHVGRDAGDRLGDDVEVLGAIAAAPSTPASAPNSRAHWPAQLTTHSQAIAPRSSPAVHSTPATRPLRASTPVDLHVLEDPRAAHARALGERLREVGGIGLAVAGDPHAAGQVVGAQHRHALSRPRRGDSHSNSTPKLFARAICRRISCIRSRRLRDVHAAALLPAGREAGLLPRATHRARCRSGSFASHCASRASGRRDRPRATSCRR